MCIRDRSTGKGRHTSTRREMVLMDSSGVLIDTPGVREFGLAIDKMCIRDSSISKDDIGNRNIEKLLYQEFQKQGIEVMFDKFYFDCSKYDEKERIEHVREYLEFLESKSTDLIPVSYTHLDLNL